MRFQFQFACIIGLAAVAGAQAPASLQLRGDRFKPLAYPRMTAEQRALTDLVLTGKIEGGANGPMNVLLRSPEYGEAILRYGAFVRFHASLPMKLNELAALVAIRYWGAQFPWYAHHCAGTQAGLTEATIAAIAEGRRPASLPSDEQVVYNFSAELLKTTQMSDATFNAAKERWESAAWWN